MGGRVIRLLNLTKIGYNSSMKCKECGQPLRCYCPACQGRSAGKVTSTRKAEAARVNGRLGGRPRKKKSKTERSKNAKK